MLYVGGKEQLEAVTPFWNLWIFVVFVFWYVLYVRFLCVCVCDQSSVHEP